MGCVNSNSVDNKDDPDKEKADKAKQRRRLSVAPHHVENKDQDQEAEKKTSDKPENENWSELELKAQGKHGWALESRKGVVPYNRNKVNQDRGVVKFALRDDVDMSLFGVMDGHGEFGHFVAAFVQEKLPQNIVAQEDLKTKTPKAITSAVKRTCEQLATTSINVAFSGTTAVFGVRVEDKLYVANIGDSRCVLCRYTDGDHFQAIPLSFDQKPENPKEKARILKAGGRVEPLPGPPGEDCGPPRVWLAEVDVPGLAMSRSIGDEVSQTVGVISTPEIVEHDLKPQDIFAIWASDGVWEFLSNEQACEIVWKNRSNYKTAAAQLVNEASKRWKQEEEVVDDITCVIVAFNQVPTTS